MAAAAEGRDRHVGDATPQAEGRREHTPPSGRTPSPPAFVPRETKLHAPRIPQRTVPRARLVEMLLTGTAPLVVFSAPAGSGKTLTVRQWLESDDRASAWLQLDAGDNDPVTLLQYVARVLIHVSPLDPVVLSWLALPEPPVQKAILPALVAAASVAPPFIMVLDDTHVVGDARCWRLLWAIVEGLSAGSTVVVCGRSDPPLPLSRLRSQALLAEYRFPQLAFDRDETGRLLALHAVAAAAAAVDDLMTATEGWPAGVYLAVLAWKTGARSVPTLAPTGDRREIADYLASEVLAEQSEEVVRFLTRTSIVWRLCPELCAVLTGRDDSALMLQAVERDNLFLMPLDGCREWYRYHHLFSEWLQVELRRREPRLIPDLHRRAAAWFERDDDVADALHHWLGAGDVQRAGDLVAARWVAYFLTGRVWTARQWVDMFTPDQVRLHAPLRVAAAWLSCFTGDVDMSRGLLLGLESPELDGPSPDGAASVRSSATIARSLLAGEGPFQMREDARLAARLEEEAGRGPWHGLASQLLGVAEMLCGDDAAAVGPLVSAAWESEALHNGVELAALGHLSLLAGDEGRWEEAEQHAAEAARRAASYELGDYLPSVPARLARDRLCARAGDDDAVVDLEELLQRADPDFCPWLGVQAGLLLAEASIERGDEPAARRRLDEANAILERWARAPGLVRRIEKLEAILRARSSVEPLSAAEVRVLELLPTSLTVAEIAGRLGVSPNTVGTHVKALHRKLGAGRRSEVVERAVAFGLLPAPRAQPPAD